MIQAMRKGLICLMSVLLGIFGSISVIIAEEDFEGNSAYYSNLCSGSELSDEQEAICTRYAQYLSDKSDTLRKELEEIEAQREEISKNIEALVAKITSYQTEINQLGAEIKQLNAEIDALQIQIDEKTLEIETKEAEKEELMQKVKDRMESAQGTMRLNQYLDFIMGAESFTDLIRRVNGINDLMSYDDHVRTELVALIEYLNEIKQQLELDKAAVETKKADVEIKQQEVVKKKKEAEIIKEEWLKQEAEWIAKGNQIVSNLNEIKDEIRNMSDVIGEIPSSSGWSKPVPSGTRKSAGTWHYPGGGTLGGGVHLGLDLAAGIGTPIYAVANGIIIKSVDGCANDGRLGNTCGGAQGGTSGGGNQIIMLARVDGMLYAVKYLHLSPGTLTSNYQTVVAGEKIAEMGKSGNVTGAHLHIEVYKLGNYTINEYIASWDGNLSFGCGWGNSALNRTCENSGSPCRMRPENVLGY